MPFLLTCLVAVLLCNCDSLAAVGQWCREQQALLARRYPYFRFLTGLVMVTYKENEAGSGRWRILR